MVVKMERFAVEKITDTKVMNGMRYYQVQWSRSWEPEDFLIDCPLLIKEFWKNYKESEKFPGIKEEITHQDYDSVLDSVFLPSHDHSTSIAFPVNTNSTSMETPNDNALFSSLQNFHSDENVFQDILEEWKNTREIEPVRLPDDSRKLKRDQSESFKESYDEPIAKSSRRLKRKARMSAIAAIQTHLKRESTNGEESDASWIEDSSEYSDIDEIPNLLSPRVVLEKITDSVLLSNKSTFKPNEDNDVNNSKMLENDDNDSEMVKNPNFHNIKAPKKKELSVNVSQLATSSVESIMSRQGTTTMSSDVISEANLISSAHISTAPIKTSDHISTEYFRPIKTSSCDNFINTVNLINSSGTAENKDTLPIIKDEVQSPLTSCKYSNFSYKNNGSTNFKQSPCSNDQANKNESNNLLLEKLFEISSSADESIKISSESLQINQSSEISKTHSIDISYIVDKKIEQIDLSSNHQPNTIPNQNCVIPSEINKNSCIISTDSSGKLNTATTLNATAPPSCSIETSHGLGRNLPFNSACSTVPPLLSSSFNSAILPPISSLYSTVFPNISAASNPLNLNLNQVPFSCNPNINWQNDLKTNQGLASGSQPFLQNRLRFSSMSEAVQNLQQAKLQLLQTMNETAANIQSANIQSANIQLFNSASLQNQMTDINFTNMLQKIQNTNPRQNLPQMWNLLNQNNFANVRNQLYFQQQAFLQNLRQDLSQQLSPNQNRPPIILRPTAGNVEVLPQILDVFSAQSNNVNNNVPNNVPILPNNSLLLPGKNNTSLGSTHSKPLNASRNIPSESNFNIPLGPNQGILTGLNYNTPSVSNHNIPMRSNPNVVMGSNNKLPLGSNHNLIVSVNNSFPFSSNQMNSNLTNNTIISNVAGVKSNESMPLNNGLNTGICSVLARRGVESNSSLQNNKSVNDLSRLSHPLRTLPNQNCANTQSSTLHYISSNTSAVERNITSNSHMVVSLAGQKSINVPVPSTYGFCESYNQAPASGAQVKPVSFPTLNNELLQIKTSQPNQKQIDDQQNSLPKKPSPARLHPFIMKNSCVEKSKEVITIEDDSLDDTNNNDSEIELGDLQNEIKKRFSTQNLMIISNVIATKVSEKRKNLYDSYCQLKFELELLRAERQKSYSASSALNTAKEESLKKRLIETVSKAKNAGCEVVHEVLKKALFKKFKINEIRNNFTTAFSILRDLIGSWGSPLTTDSINKNNFVDNYVFNYPK